MGVKYLIISFILIILFILVKYMEGHVEDLVAPDDPVRPLLMRHVASLKEQFENTQLLPSNPIIVNISLPGKDNINKDLLEKGGVYMLEVLAGNHRREALQQLLSAAETPLWLKEKLKRWPMQVYLNLTKYQKIKVAYRDNMTEEYREGMTYQHIAVLFRKELLYAFGLGPDDPTPEVTNRKDEFNSAAKWRQGIADLLSCHVSTT